MFLFERRECLWLKLYLSLQVHQLLSNVTANDHANTQKLNAVIDAFFRGKLIYTSVDFKTQCDLYWSPCPSILMSVKTETYRSAEHFSFRCFNCIIFCIIGQWDRLLQFYLSYKQKKICFEQCWYNRVFF